MDELEIIEDVVSADLFEEYLGCRECGLVQEVQWLTQHPDRAEEFTALGVICDRLAAIPLSPAQRLRQRNQVQERCQPSVPDVHGIVTVLDTDRNVRDLLEEPLPLN